MYEIVEWLQRYEVNSKGQAAEAGDKLRRAPLTYYRAKVTGTSQGLGYRKLLGMANSQALEVFGIFHKLLEIAAGRPRESRGRIDQSIGELAMIIGIDEQNIRNALSILSDKDLGWLQKTPEIPGKPGISRNSQKLPETPGKEGALYNETKRNETDTETETEKGINTQGNLQEEVEGRCFFGFSKEGFSLSVRPMVLALHWYHAVRPLLYLKNEGDVKCLTDIQRWLVAEVKAGDLTIYVFERIWLWIKGATDTKNPIAVLQARLKKELGYECKSKR